MRWRGLTKWTMVIVFGVAAGLALARAKADDSSNAPRHFAVNENFDGAGRFAPLAYGFNIADVSSAESLNGLPDGVLGLMWVGQCGGADGPFRALVESVIHHPKLFGFYLMDDPDPSGRWRPRCRGEDLRAEVDWIHARRANAVTFIALMNVGDDAAPAFDPALRPENSHVDLFGVAPYPCRRNWQECDFAMIGHFVEAARRVGIPDSSVVPIYQTFGGGAWSAAGGGYRLPEAWELRRIVEIWSKLISTPVFDYAYSWGSQRSDMALGTSAPLLEVLGQHNGATRDPPARLDKRD